MRVLVTGAAGFIGAYVCGELARRGDTFVAFDIALDPSWDVRNIAALAEAMRGCDAVVHLAANIDVPSSWKRPGDFHDTNATGTLNVVRAANRLGIGRVVYASSAACIEASDPYGVTKLAGEKYVTLLHPFGVALRFFNVYGRGAKVGVVKYFGDVLRAGESPRIDGDGTQTRDFVHVEDVARAIVDAQRSQARGVFEVGTGVETKIGELADMIGLRGRCTIPDRPNQIRASVSNHRRWLPGWRPKISLAHGLQHTINAE